ncbi:MAG: hydroxyethylthiazole kinase, partial [Methanobrevibacter arboriphilus]|nr:hydroxyethylthiazole kinase [Methanobrevibacter arboriphilus]
MIKANSKIIKDIIQALENVKNNTPLTHCITNYVTINDCANAVLAIGGSPMMADDPEEVEEFVEIADTLVINIGKMSQSQIEAMIIGSKHGMETNTPIVLDPVA